MEDTTIISIIESMIDFFFDSGIYDYDRHTLNNFVARINFDYIRDYVIDGLKLEIIKKTSVFTAQEEREVKPSRRTEEEKEAYRIKNAPRTEEITREKIEHWKSSR
jgi:1,4-alpha-glucan branching enzyme